MGQATRTLLALVGGLLLGIALAARAPGVALHGVAIAQPVGTAWLNALQMTIVPLVIALLVLGVSATADAARAGRIAARTLVLVVVILFLSSLMAAFVTPLLLRLWPLAPGAAAALRSALAETKPVGVAPAFTDFLASVVPSNPIAAAANDAFLPLIVFALVFAFAITRLAEPQRKILVDLFQAITDAMLVIIGWVLWLAPLGVFALALVVGVKAGTAAFGALVHYVAIVAAVGAVVWIASFPLGAWGGRIGLSRFARSTAPAQAVALSTQSSLASLPAMLKGVEDLGVPAATSGIVLPLAVAIFRATGPCMNLAVAIYVAIWFGVPLHASNMAAGVAVATLTTMGAVSLPGAISYVSSIAPICVAMGAPVAPLGLLVAIETFPDLMRTLGNVTADMALTTIIAARGGDEGPTLPEDKLLDQTTG
jgi:proton glutamate symport protein